MRKIFFVLMITFLFSVSAYADTWKAKLIGGVDNDFAYAVAKSGDGGWIVVGSSSGIDEDDISGNGQADAYVAKFDASGNRQWQKLYGGVDIDYANAVTATADGGYIIAGVSASDDIAGTNFHGEEDFYVVKLDKSGNKEWEKLFGGSRRDIATSVVQTADGNYIVAGFAYSKDISSAKANGANDAYVVNLDKNGNTIWEGLYGGRGDDIAYSAARTVDGGCIIAGVSDSKDLKGAKNNGFYDYYLAKLDQAGKLQWQKLYGGNNWDVGTAVKATTDGGYIIAGRSYSDNIKGVKNHGRDDFYVIKTDKAGSKQWDRMFGGSSTDWANAVIQTKDGGFIIAGDTLSTDLKGEKNNGRYDAYFVRIDSKGKLIWQKTYGGNWTDGAAAVMQKDDGGFIGVGCTISSEVNGMTSKGGDDMYLIQMNKDGK